MSRRFALSISVSVLFVAAAFGQTTQPASTQPAAIPTSAATRIPHKRPPAGTTLEISIKELGNFDYDQNNGGNIPADVKALSGSKLRLRGYMIPTVNGDDITQFVLVPHLLPNFQPPLIQNTVVVNCPQGRAVTYFPDEIVVEGTLSVEEKKDHGFIVSIFELTPTSVRTAPK
jgi:hypothetical protein